MNTASSEWLSLRAAAKRLGVPDHKMQNLIDLELVETLRLPRSHALVSARDLDRLIEESHRPAKRELSRA
jgi:hypothetical protein